MFKRKLIASLLLAVLIVAMQTGIAAAAPASQSTTPITGTIKSITIVKGTATTEATVLVAVLDSLGKTQRVYISVDTAVLLGLVTLDPVTKLPVVDKTKIGQTITIEPAQILPPPTETEETGEQPVAVILANHFDVEYSVILDYYAQGFGYGEIAQALFIAQKLGDVALAGDILNAKKTGDYSAFTLTDGSTPTTWGQLRNAVLGHGRHNLGAVVSGNANSSTDDDNSAPGNSGNAGSNGNGHDPNKEHGNGKGQGNGKP
jgi:hypothetical protein